MHLIFNKSLNYAHSLFKEEMPTLLTTEDNKVAIVTTVIFGCLGAYVVFKHFCFNAKHLKKESKKDSYEIENKDKIYTQNPIFALTRTIKKCIAAILAKQTEETTKKINAQNTNSSLLEIDSQLIKTVKAHGGGFYYHKIDAIVPRFPTLVRAEWLNCKNAILARIGPIYPTPTKKSALWKNSATTIDQLITDAKMAAPYFWNMCLNIAHQTGGIANFGINNRHMIKSKKSLSLKIQESMKDGLSSEESVSKIRDALRETIIADTPEQIPSIIQALKEYAAKMGRECVFINIWEHNRSSGYVGIHAKMLFPIYRKYKFYKQRNIIIEIQIHLKCIMDGTPTCVKEREHLIYDQMRLKKIDPEIQTAASTLLYLTALKQCPN